jgi:hypothetical protein
MFDILLLITYLGTQFRPGQCLLTNATKYVLHNSISPLFMLDGSIGEQCREAVAILIIYSHYTKTVS